MTSVFVPVKGFEISAANFSHHRTACKRCQKFDPAIPTSVAEMCLEGVVLWKAEQPREKAERPERPRTWASKEEVRKLTKYK